MDLDADELKARTRKLGLRIITLVEALPPSKAANVIGNQLLRSGLSVGANYRAACRARSKPNFISKAGIAIEEADESLYWMEMLAEAELISRERLAPLMGEVDEVIAILTASAKTARANLKRSGA